MMTHKTLAIFFVYAFASLLISCKSQCQYFEMQQVKAGDRLVDIVNIIGMPEHQFSVGGIQDRTTKEKFALQWDVNFDSLATLEGSYDARITAWFDSQGRLVKFLVRHQDEGVVYSIEAD